MQITKYSKDNLKKDKNVLGSKWKKTYNSYFSDIDNINIFIKSSFDYIKKINKDSLNILYVGSASGLLGEKLCVFLKKNNIDSNLTLLDISKKHLLENTNKNTKKIIGDMLTFKLSKFDVVIMRSSLDYLPTKLLQIKALKNIKSCLSENGIFINCVAALPSNKSRDLADKIYNSNNKIGNRHFQSNEDIKSLYISAGFNYFKKIGLSKNLIITHNEHIRRYNIVENEIYKIKNILKSSKSRYLKSTLEGYRLEFIFPIYVAR